MTDNVITPEDKREVLKQITIGNISVSKDGKVNGYIPVGIREDTDFNELMEEADKVEGSVTISFKKMKNQDDA